MIVDSKILKSQPGSWFNHEMFIQVEQAPLSQPCTSLWLWHKNHILLLESQVAKSQLELWLQDQWVSDCSVVNKHCSVLNQENTAFSYQILSYCPLFTFMVSSFRSEYAFP